MYAQPTHIELEKIPRFDSAEEAPFADKIIHAQVLNGSSDWYIAEFDPELQNTPILGGMIFSSALDARHEKDH